MIAPSLYGWAYQSYRNRVSFVVHSKEIGLLRLNNKYTCTPCCSRSMLAVLHTLSICYILDKLNILFFLKHPWAMLPFQQTDAPCDQMIHQLFIVCFDNGWYAIVAHICQQDGEVGNPKGLCILSTLGESIAKTRPIVTKKNYYVPKICRIQASMPFMV